MADVGKPSGLVKRGNAYYCRLRYPSDIVERLGRAEFNRSLRTGLYPDAVKRLPAARAEFDAEVLLARAASAGIRRTAPTLTRPDHPARLTEDLAHRLALSYFRSQLRKLDREELPARSSQEWRDHVSGVEIELAAISDPDDPNTSRWIEAAEIGLLTEHQLGAGPSSEESQLLRAYLRRSMLQIAQLRRARLHGDYLDRINDRMFETGGQASAGRLSQTGRSARLMDASGVMLDTTIVDRWAAERKPDQKGIDAHRAAARWLYNRVGRKPVDQLTRKHFLSFKAKLIDEGQSAANIKQKLSRLRTLMQWAADNSYVASNPAHGVTIKDATAAKRKRVPFDLPALTAIFSSPVYARGERPIRLRGEAGYWLPALALFTGARLEELGQLRSEDVFERRYSDAEGSQRSAWFIHIREDADAGLRLKNAGSERRIPVHPELVRLGFLELVSSAKEENRQRLFHLLKPDRKYGRLTGKWGEYWSIYRRKVCGVSDPRMVFHSFRHTFKDYSRLAGIAEGIQRQLMGHSGRDVADHYGSGHPDHVLVEAMSRYQVPGLKIAAVRPFKGAA